MPCERNATLLRRKIRPALDERVKLKVDSEFMSSGLRVANWEVTNV